MDHSGKVDGLRAIQSVVDGRLMPWRAAERLGLSRRQILRPKTRRRRRILRFTPLA
jgi:hypothetical protein